MLENPAVDSSTAANVAPVKPYAPPNQRSRALGRRKSGGVDLRLAALRAMVTSKKKAGGGSGPAGWSRTPIAPKRPSTQQTGATDKRPRVGPAPAPQPNVEPAPDMLTLSAKPAGGPSGTAPQAPQLRAKIRCPQDYYPDWDHESTLEEPYVCRQLIDSLVLPAEREERGRYDGKDEFDFLRSCLGDSTRCVQNMAQACTSLSHVVRFQKRHLDRILFLQDNIKTLQEKLQKQTAAHEAAMKKAQEDIEERERVARHMKKKAKKAIKKFLISEDYQQRLEAHRKEKMEEYFQSQEFSDRVITEASGFYDIGFKEALEKVRAAFPNLDLRGITMGTEDVQAKGEASFLEADPETSADPSIGLMKEDAPVGE